MTQWPWSLEVPAPPPAPPSAPRVRFLEATSERVVRHAVDEFLDGALTPEIEGELVIETQSSRYRFIDGICFSASSDDLVGAELVGWLLENDRSSAVSAWWRRGARAVLLARRAHGEIVVTSPARSLLVDGKPARDGFATQQARFIADKTHPGETSSVEEEISLELEEEHTLRPSSPAEPPSWDQRMRLPTHALPVAPSVARELGPVTLPPVSLPPPRR